MQDLNDLRYFAAVVEHGGFAPAGRALKLPKSKLSRRVAGLEERLGVRLLERSTRRLRVTDVGQAFHRHCAAMLAEAAAAEDAVARLHSEPRGLVRISCPIALAQSVMAVLLPRFLADYPQVRLQLLATNRRIDLVEERVDLALRVRSNLEGDAALIRRPLGTSRTWLVAAPRLLAELGAPADPAELQRFPTLSPSEEEGPDSWTLLHAVDGRSERVTLTPRLASSDFTLLHQAACEGLGIALLPDQICERALREGRLLQALPDWQGGEGLYHLVYTARRGLLPAVRALIDHLVAGFPSLLAACRAIGAPSFGAEAGPAATEP